MKIVDSHCHLDGSAFAKDRSTVIDRFKNVGGQAMVIAGIDEKSSRAAVTLAGKNERVYASVGIHPHDATTCNPDVLSKLQQLAQHQKVVAWGEIGLDFNRMYSPRNVQEQAFVAQLALADSLGLPIIFHERETGGRFLAMLNAHPNPGRSGVVHCFSGNRNELEHYLALGFYIGITGIITLKQRGKNLRELVTAIPSDRLLVETDAPYLTPAPEKNRTRRNEPAFVRSVLMKVAEVRQEDPETFSEIVWQNTCHLFQLPVS